VDGAIANGKKRSNPLKICNLLKKGRNMIGKLKAIKKNYTDAKKQGGNASDVIELIDLFMDLFKLAENLDPRLVSDLKQDLTPPMGSGNDVATTAAMLQNDLVNPSQHIVIAPTGVCVSRAIIALIESGGIKNQTALNNVYLQYTVLLNKLEVRI
jgi:hypothetical protein